MAIGALLVGRSTQGLLIIVAWAAVIAVAHQVAVPAPSGGRLRLGIGPAVAASMLIHDPASVGAAFAFGMAAAWIIAQVREPRGPARDTDFLAETLSLGAYAVVHYGAAERLSNVPLSASVTALLAVVAAGLAWYIVRASAQALVGLEREDLSPRYLWLLSLEDWAVAMSLFATGALFGLTFPVMGLWALPVAIMPYAFSHLAFVRYHETRITYGQTIRALAQIPEVAGLAPVGHSSRTAELSISMAREIGLHPNHVTDLEFAALMHDIGRITLNEPAILKAGYTDEDIARWGAQIIAEAPYLQRVADLVEQQYRPYRTPGVERDPDVPAEAKIIKVASAYDQCLHEKGMPPLESLEQLYVGQSYEYDPEVTSSLRRVLVHRGHVP